MATKNATHRFRLSELALARAEADRLGCGASDVVRAALARVARKPLTHQEVQRVRLSRGIGGMTPANQKRVQRIGSLAAAKRKKRLKRGNSESIPAT